MPSTENTTRILKKRMIEELTRCMGIVTKAAEALGIDRHRHYQWLDKDPQYKKDVDSIQDIVTDFAESQLYKQVKDGDTAAIIFYLKCRGKKRGYIEKQELNVLLPTQETVINLLPDEF